MADLINLSLPYAGVISHIVLAVLVLALIFHNSWGREVANFLGKHSIKLAFLVSLIAVSSSLFYSEVMGFEPCMLCWLQRVCLYPMVIIFGVALWEKATSAFMYAVPIVAIGAVIAAYHQYVYLGGTSILPCTALGGACLKNYVFAFGYITIPMMSLTISLYILLLAVAHRIYLSR